MLHSCLRGITGSLLWTPVRPERVVPGFLGGWGFGGGGGHAFAGKAQQLQSSDAEQKKSESSTSHKTLSSGIVYRQTGITAAPPPPTAPTTLSHTCRQKVPSPRVPPHQRTHAPTHARTNFHYLRPVLRAIFSKMIEAYTHFFL